MSENCKTLDSPSNSAIEQSGTSSAKTCEAKIDENFVLMSTPDKFKDKPEPDSSVRKTLEYEEPKLEITSLDCLLLSDFSPECAPQHVKNLSKFYNPAEHRREELLFQLVYLVALEIGFAEVHQYAEYEQFLCKLSSSSSFHSKNVLRLSGLKPMYNKSEDAVLFSMKLRSIVNLCPSNESEITALLVGYVTGDLLIITLSPANSTGDRGYSIALPVARYVLPVHKKTNPIYYRFQNMDELSMILRNRIFVPIRNQHMYLTNASLIPALDGLPRELYINIFLNLDFNSLKAFANISKWLNIVILDK